MPVSDHGHFNARYFHIGQSKDFASGIHNRAFEIGHSTMSITNLAMPIFRHRANPLSIVEGRKEREREREREGKEREREGNKIS
jgi:hypothetical protein